MLFIFFTQTLNLHLQANCDGQPIPGVMGFLVSGRRRRKKLAEIIAIIFG
jgi:hypothetical protein